MYRVTYLQAHTRATLTSSCFTPKTPEEIKKLYESMPSVAEVLSVDPVD